MLNLVVNHKTEPIRYDDFMETMADRIKQLRVAHGLTQEQLGKLVGTSKVAVSLWESGKVQNIKLDTFLRVCSALGTDPTYLIWGPERRDPTKTHRRI